jgi:hypothetical protein
MGMGIGREFSSLGGDERRGEERRGEERRGEAPPLLR